MSEPLSFAFYLSSVPFNRDVLTWQTSLGGSESACLVTMRALAQRGHRVSAFAEQLDINCHGWTDDAGVTWWQAETLPDAFTFMRFDVFVSLRMHIVFGLQSTAKLNLLWGQDMLINTISGAISSVDGIVYVSDWQKRQWAAVDDILPRFPSFITPNAIDPAMFNVPPYRAVNLTAPSFIHVSRPERGLEALLALWPNIRARWPKATLSLCRYSSMYDAQGWGRICAAFDAKVQAVHAKVGGITYLGELTKTELYQAISRADLMLYPTSQVGFGETNCIACTESQMCGTPFLGSMRGALPETLHPEAGRLIDHPADDCWQDPIWQDRWVATMAEMLNPIVHRRMAVAGRKHAERAFAGAVAEHWEREIRCLFADRTLKYPRQILTRLLNDDNHVLAKRLLNQTARGYLDLEQTEIYKFCERVISGEDQNADDYATNAIQDGKREGEVSQRIGIAADALAEWLPKDRPPRVLDYACGNGAFAHALTSRLPDVIFNGVDYSPNVLTLARQAVPTAAFWSVDEFNSIENKKPVDGAFCGEFLEHTEKPWDVIAMIESHVADGGTIVFTMPSGPWTELMPPGQPIKRGHLWMYDDRDLRWLFGMKKDVAWQYYRVGDSPKGTAIGIWVVRYRCDRSRVSPAFTDSYLDHALLTERPYTTIHAAMIMKDEAPNILKCLDTIRRVVDKVVIYDTGSTDISIELAEKAGATVMQGEWTGDFQAARNASLAAAEPGADVILWVDCDEWLTEPGRLRQAITMQSPFVGWALKQFHFQADKPNFHDKPVRAFRTGHNVKFWGIVHEQPGVSINEGVLPTLMLERPMILHTGYSITSQRIAKMLNRNLALLEKEVKGQGAHPPRDLAWVLLMRDLVNLAMIEGYEREHLNQHGKLWLAQCLSIYRKRFQDHAAPLHELAYDYYQQALQMSGAGIGVKWAFGAGQNVDSARLKPESFRALTHDEAKGIITQSVTGFLDQLQGKPIPVPPPAESAACVRVSEAVNAGA